MGMTLREMLSDEHESVLKVGKGEVKLRTIDPAMVSADLMEAIAELDRIDTSKLTIQIAAEMLALQARVVVGLVTNWDVIGDNGQPVPLELATVKKLPRNFLGMVISHVISGAASQGEAQPGKRTERTSGATSSQAARSATARTGTPTSSPANVSTFRPGNWSQPKQPQHKKASGQRRHW